VRANSYNVLFLCKHNAGRSIMAEAILNGLATDQKKFRAYSAGSDPAGKINPYAMEQIRTAGLATDGLRSKHWSEFTVPGAPVMHFVFTLRDPADGEPCPVWPGAPLCADWSVPDPSLVSLADGSDQARRRAFSNTFIFLHNRIGVFASLPFDKLGREGLREQLDGLRSERVSPLEPDV
jgi:arsenate reductase (thioredoxin)